MKAALMDRNSHFQQTLWDLQRKLGQQVLVPLGSLSARDRIAVGFAEIDALIGGGIRVGQVTALIGAPSAGVTSLGFSLMAQAQKQGRSVFALDFSGSFDPWTALQWGVLPELTSAVYAPSVEDSLDVLRLLIREAPRALIVLDAADRQRGTALLNALPRLLTRTSGELVKNHGALIVLLPRLPGKAAQTLFETILLLERQSWLLRDDDIVGYHTRATLLKDSALNEARSTLIEIWLKGEPK
jgi:hypothetical protein